MYPSEQSVLTAGPVHDYIKYQTHSLGLICVSQFYAKQSYMVSATQYNIFLVPLKKAKKVQCDETLNFMPNQAKLCQISPIWGATTKHIGFLAPPKKAPKAQCGDGLREASASKNVLVPDSLVAVEDEERYVFIYIGCSKSVFVLAPFATCQCRCQCIMSGFMPGPLS